jgi:hypothetical protein
MAIGAVRLQATDARRQLEVVVRLIGQPDVDAWRCALGQCLLSTFRVCGLTAARGSSQFNIIDLQLAWLVVALY